LWLSVPAGIIIFIVCLSGTILVFQDEIQEIMHPQLYFNSNKGQKPLSLEVLIPKVQNQLKNNQIKDVRIFSDVNRNYAMGLTEGFRTTAYVNPCTGEITGIYDFKESSFYWIMSLHRWLLDDTRTWGKYAVGIATLIFIVILISGVIIWLPKKWKKQRFVVETKKGKKRLFYDLHSVLGAYAFLILFISAITGPMWSFEWYRNGVYKILGAELPKRGEAEKAGKGRIRGQETKLNTEQNTDYTQWQKVANKLQKQNLQNEYIIIQNGSALVHQKHAPTLRASDKYEFEKETGVITSSQFYKDQPYDAKIPGWYHDLHVGTYWGIWSKILTFIAGLIGTSLPITGYYLWWRKWKRKVKTI
jgi:uncharacterized iron-regulated membrane protein